MNTRLIPTRALLAASFLLTAPTTWAHPFDSSKEDLPAFFYISGVQERTEGTDVTYNIPVDSWPDSITIVARGGDGGGAVIDSGKTAQGGGGAQLRATFAIHPGNTSALRPGGELRFVVGGRGHGRSDEGNLASGGGGTGVFYRAPEEGAAWELLMLAGGGGGACVSTVATQAFASDGKNANTITAGDDAGGAGVGWTLSASGTRGGGAGTVDENNASNQGGGGCCHFDSRATGQTAMERDGSELNGIAQVTTSESGGGPLSGPTITLAGSSTVTITSHSSYTDAGVSATDVYGNTITLDSDNHYFVSTLDEKMAGTYTYTHFVTDQFGNTSFQNRTVIVAPQTAPSFSILGDVSTARNSGAQSISNFAYGFNAHDTGQSLGGYVLTNDNNALFSTQPAVDISGRLTFTPAADTVGSATVTITGYDNGEENNSARQTFTIAIDEVEPGNLTSTPVRPTANDTGLEINVVMSDNLVSWSTPGELGLDYLPVGLFEGF